MSSYSYANRHTCKWLLRIADDFALGNEKLAKRVNKLNCQLHISALRVYKYIIVRPLEGYQTFSTAVIYTSFTRFDGSPSKYNHIVGDLIDQILHNINISN